MKKYSQCKNIWTLKVELWDTYNFDEIRTLKNGISSSNIANDLGYLMQNTSMLKTYTWKVEFSCTLRYSEVMSI